MLLEFGVLKDLEYDTSSSGVVHRKRGSALGLRRTRVSSLTKGLGSAFRDSIGSVNRYCERVVSSIV
jgi:hypothetical protein